MLTISKEVCTSHVSLKKSTPDMITEGLLLRMPYLSAKTVTNPLSVLGGLSNFLIIRMILSSIVPY